MWPFTSTEKNEEIEISSNLPENLKDFYKQVSPNSKHESIFEVTPQHKRVNEVLQKSKGEYSYDFQKYKGTETPRRVVGVNCAEVQQKVIECLRGWTLTKTSQCEKEIESNKACVEIQNKALKNLFYDDCVNKDQCEKIRVAVDHFYTKNFGRYGDDVNLDTQKAFESDIDKVFYKVWR